MLFSQIRQVKDERSCLGDLLASRIIDRLVWYIHVREVALKSCLALNATIPNLTDFVAIEDFPLLRVELDEEVNNENAVHKVEEGIAHVALVLRVSWQVEEIVVILVVAVKGLKQHGLGVLVRNVLNHNRGASVLACEDGFKIHLKADCGRGGSLIRGLVWLLARHLGVISHQEALRSHVVVVAVKVARVGREVEHGVVSSWPLELVRRTYVLLKVKLLLEGSVCSKLSTTAWLAHSALVAEGRRRVLLKAISAVEVILLLLLVVDLVLACVVCILVASYRHSVVLSVIWERFRRKEAVVRVESLTLALHGVAVELVHMLLLLKVGIYCERYLLPSLRVVVSRVDQMLGVESGAPKGRVVPFGTSSVVAELEHVQGEARFLCIVLGVRDDALVLVDSVAVYLGGNVAYLYLLAQSFEGSYALLQLLVLGYHVVGL